VSKKLHAGEGEVVGGVCLFYSYRTGEGRNKVKLLIGKHSHMYFKNRAIATLKNYSYIHHVTCSNVHSLGD